MQDSNISWTDHTFNPWTGCTKVSPGCANCYAEQWSKRSGHKVGKWGKGAPRVRTKTWGDPVKWNKAAAGAERRPRVFCASLADWLDDEVPIEWLLSLLKHIQDTPNLDWLLLTKRPENWRSRLAAALDFVGGVGSDWAVALWINYWLEGDAPSNVWIGATTENQELADKRIPILQSIPAGVRFLSCEPLLGPIDLRDFTSFGGTHLPGIDWVIVGGESGPGYRPHGGELADKPCAAVRRIRGGVLCETGFRI